MTPLSSAARTKKVKKNSSPLNQWDEEEILFSEKAPGPPDGWKRKQTCRVRSFVFLIQRIASIMVLGLFHTTERSFGNCSQIARSIPAHFPKVKENADEILTKGFIIHERSHQVWYTAFSLTKV